MENKADGKRRGSAVAKAALSVVKPGLSVSTYQSSWGLTMQTRLLPQVATNIYITTHNSEMTLDLILHRRMDPRGL